MTGARFFLFAVVACTAAATSVAAQAPGMYARAIDKAHVVSDQTSARTTETNGAMTNKAPATAATPGGTVGSTAKSPAPCCRLPKHRLRPSRKGSPTTPKGVATRS